MINSLKRVNEKLTANLKEAKFELMKPVNLIGDFNYIVSDSAGIYTVDTSEKDENGNKHYILKDNSPSNISIWSKKGVNHIIETYKSEQGIELISINCKEFFKSKIERLKNCIESNEKMIQTFDK